MGNNKIQNSTSPWEHITGDEYVNKANHPPVSSESGEKLFFDEEGSLIENQPTAPIEQPPTFTFIPSKTYVGRYCLGGNIGFCIAFERKPNWFHRTMMKACLGWEWTDIN